MAKSILDELNKSKELAKQNDTQNKLNNLLQQNNPQGQKVKEIDEQILNIKESIEQHENRINKLLQQNKSEIRKARTRRLIERGAILESLIDGAESYTNEQIKNILVFVLRNFNGNQNQKSTQEQPH